MVSRFAAGAIAIFGVAGAAAAQTPGEWLAQASLPQLKVGYQVSRDGNLIVERIPPGETVEDWSRMVTTQRFANVIAEGLTLPLWVDRFVGGLRTSCPHYRLEGPSFSKATGGAVVKFRVDCPLNPATGKPESLLLHAIAGKADLHVVQVAFRHVPTKAEEDWARAHLATVTLCNKQSGGVPCRGGSGSAAPR